ncbi:MAG: hypothetical protein IJW01_07750 [Paludibacteraceae bacterium]|nr:hypothetical protein [Paludibacteraceae bacterium]
MAENKTMDSIHKGILKKFHTLCTVLGLSYEEKHAIVESYGVESSRDMDTHDLLDVCAKLSCQLGSQKNTLDHLRKRAMASIGSYLKSVGRESNANLIKAIACRATGYEEFNKIPRERLLNLIATFNNKLKDLQGVNDAIASIMLQSFTNNTKRYDA